MGVQEGLTALKNPSPLVGGPATQELDQIENIVNNATSISGNYGDLQQYGDWFVNVLGPLSTQLINGAITPETVITQLDTDTAAFYQSRLIWRRARAKCVYGAPGFKVRLAVNPKL